MMASNMLPCADQARRGQLHAICAPNHLWFRESLRCCVMAAPTVRWLGIPQLCLTSAATSLAGKGVGPGQQGVLHAVFDGASEC